MKWAATLRALKSLAMRHSRGGGDTLHLISTNLTPQTEARVCSKKLLQKKTDFPNSWGKNRLPQQLGKEGKRKHRGALN